MGFCFKRKEAVSRGVKRLAVEEIEAALAALKKSDRPASVHRARKEIKKVRAILRLTRDRLSQKEYKFQTRLLRKAAAGLAPLRDAYVMAAALESLKPRLEGKLSRGAYRQLQERLGGSAARAHGQSASKKTVRKVRRLLRRIPEQWEALRFEAKGWDLLAPGLRRAYAAGREGYQLAQSEPTAENLHDWRKRVKDLWSQLFLLRRAAPRELKKTCAELEALSDQLGDDHDLHLVEEAARVEDGETAESIGKRVFYSAIAGRRRNLRRSALRVAARVYADSPETFCARVEGYWKRWRARPA